MVNLYLSSVDQKALFINHIIAITTHYLFSQKQYLPKSKIIIQLAFQDKNQFNPYN